MTKLADSGDVVVLDFPGVTGTKRRPAVVVSSAVYHKERPDVIVGLITSQTAAAVAATDYLLQDWAAANFAASFRLSRILGNNAKSRYYRAYWPIVTSRLEGGA